MTNSAPLDMRRPQRTALLVGALALVGSLVGLFLDPPQFIRSYLFAYLFWLGLATGSLALLLLHHLAGGTWSAVLLRFLEAAARTLPLLAVAFVPIAFGTYWLYPWAQPQQVAADPVLQQKAPYLNQPFFLLRSVVYLALWLVLAQLVTRWSLALDETGDPRLARCLRNLGAVGLPLAGVAGTFAAIDWMMSLEPHWYSTVYGALVSVSAVLTAFSAAVALVAWFGDRPPLASVLTPRLFNDFGNLLLTFVMLWAYLAYSQYLVIWSGNLREEIPWYLQRQQGGWEYVFLIVVVFSFLLPFLVLLSRDLKRRGRFLGGVAAVVLVTRAVDSYWLIMPAFSPARLRVHWLDPLLLVAIGGLWTAFYLRGLARYPLLAQADPRLRPAPAAEMERAHAG